MRRYAAWALIGVAVAIAVVAQALMFAAESIGDKADELFCD